MLQKCKSKINQMTEMPQARTWGCGFCPLLLAGSSLLACVCAWQSQGREGLLFPCRLLRPLNLSAQCPPSSLTRLCRCVWRGRCAKVVNIPSQELKHIYNLKTAHGDLINAWSFYFLPETWRAYPPFDIPPVLWHRIKICLSFCYFYLSSPLCLWEMWFPL